MKKLSYTKEDKLWRWEVSGEENRYYCTNSEGEGIFEVSFSPLGGDRRQLTGTCQFDLSGLSDEEKLGFTYDVLDRYIRTGEIHDDEVKAKIDRLHKINQFKLRYMDSFVYKQKPENR